MMLTLRFRSLSGLIGLAYAFICLQTVNCASVKSKMDDTPDTDGRSDLADNIVDEVASLLKDNIDVEVDTREMDQLSLLLPSKADIKELKKEFLSNLHQTETVTTTNIETQSVLLTETVTHLSPLPPVTVTETVLQTTQITASPTTTPSSTKDSPGKIGIDLMGLLGRKQKGHGAGGSSLPNIGKNWFDSSHFKATPNLFQGGASHKGGLSKLGGLLSPGGLSLPSKSSLGGGGGLDSGIGKGAGIGIGTGAGAGPSLSPEKLAKAQKIIKKILKEYYKDKLAQLNNSTNKVPNINKLVQKLALKVSLKMLKFFPDLATAGIQWFIHLPQDQKQRLYQVYGKGRVQADGTCPHAANETVACALHLTAGQIGMLSKFF